MASIPSHQHTRDFYFLPVCKVVVNSSKITWCFHYHHCAASEAPSVTSLLKIIVEIIHPILKMQQYNNSYRCIVHIPLKIFVLIHPESLDYIMQKHYGVLFQSTNAAMRHDNHYSAYSKDILTRANVRSKSAISLAML